MSKNPNSTSILPQLPSMPEVRFNKSGYEIRTDVLAMAKDLVTQDFHMKWQGWEVTATRDEKTGQIVNKVDMPQFPGLDRVLDTAEQMYAFISASSDKMRK